MFLENDEGIKNDFTEAVSLSSVEDCIFDSNSPQIHSRMCKMSGYTVTSFLCFASIEPIK